MAVSLILGTTLIAAIAVSKSKTESEEEISCCKHDMRKKKVHITPCEKNIYYEDSLSVEERSKLWITSRELKLYKQNAKESIGMFRACNGNNTLVDSSKYCMGGLESFYEENELTKKEVQEYHVHCTLNLQDYNGLLKRGIDMYTSRYNRLVSTIKELNDEATARALNRAAADRSAVDAMYEDFDRSRQSLKIVLDSADVTTVTRPTMAEDSLPRVKFARGA